MKQCTVLYHLCMERYECTIALGLLTTFNVAFQHFHKYRVHMCQTVSSNRFHSNFSSKKYEVALR